MVVALVLRAHGVRGEIKCRVVTDFPERFNHRGLVVFAGVPPRPRRVRSARLSGGEVLLRLEGIDTPEAAAELRGQEILVRTEDAVPLPPGKHYWHDVIGLRAEDPDGVEYGQVREILETGSNDVYVVQGPRGEILIPATHEVLAGIEPERGRLLFNPLPGMVPEAPARARRRGRHTEQPRRARPDPS